MLTKEQAVKLAQTLTEAIDTVLYAHDKKIIVDSSTVDFLRSINSQAKELLR